MYNVDTIDTKEFLGGVFFFVKYRLNKKITKEVEQTRVKWVPVTTAWRVLRLRMEERPAGMEVAANILNKQSRTADKG